MGSGRRNGDQGRGGSRGKPFFESAGLPSACLVIDVLLLIVCLLVWRLPTIGVVLVHLGFLSTITFLIFGYDKWRAKKDRRRVSEMNLFILSILGGAAGGLIGMWTWRHKGRHLRFKLIIPTALFFHLVLVTYLLAS